MIAISDFMESIHGNNKIVQMALREIDTHDLSHAMLGFSEDEQHIVLRNMSKRASKLLLAEMDEEREQTPSHRIESAAEQFLQKLRKHARYLAKSDEDAKEKLRQITLSADVPHPGLPNIAIEDEDGIVDTFVAIQKFVKKHGILALEGIEDRIDHPVMRKGIEYIIDGWEPMFMQTILETYKSAYLKEIEKRLEMMLAGIDSLASRDMPLATEERLKAFIPK